VPASGEVGRHTYEILGRSIDGQTAADGKPVLGSRSLTIGDWGYDIRMLQNRLNCLRYARIIQHPATAYYDWNTANALKAFRADTALFRQWIDPEKDRSDQETFDLLLMFAIVGGRPLSRGCRGLDVVGLQVVLHNMNLYHQAIDGFFQAQTESAVRRFQADHHLTCDGIVACQTCYALGRHHAAFWYAKSDRPHHTISAYHVRWPWIDMAAANEFSAPPTGLALAPTRTISSTPTFFTALPPIDSSRDTIIQSVSEDHLPQAVASITGTPQAFVVHPQTRSLWITTKAGGLFIINPQQTRNIPQNIRQPLWQETRALAFNCGSWYNLPDTVFSIVQDGRRIVRQTIPVIASSTQIIGEIADGSALLWTPMQDTLYVLEKDAARLLAYDDASTAQAIVPRKIYHGTPLNHPIAMTFH
ncbi:MAG: peptidoglycan-binding protein, partial [Firmicutes bacterium]|nr:peptidoglycan-binding protein [Bacillota bacterium]